MKQVHEKIRKWYKKHGRKELPWRNTSDPYPIYLSEIMLQQTQVNTVLERYYFPFLKKFPTFEALGKAPLDDVMKMWEGLGYYNRAKNLHRTAALLCQKEKQTQENSTTLPSDINALMELPGIGINTAHAIAAFAFRQSVPVMEANVKRILCRLHKLTTPTDKILWELAYSHLDKKHSFDYNQAMMDIGATLCTPKNPHCTQCPLSALCLGKEEPTRYPTKKKRVVPKKEQHIMLTVYDDKLALSQRTGKFLHGLWGFPSTEVPLCASEYLGEVSHAYTHFKLLCKVWIYYETDSTQEHYFTVEEIRKLAISKVDEKIVKLYLDTIQHNTEGGFQYGG